MPNLLHKGIGWNGKWLERRYALHAMHYVSFNVKNITVFICLYPFTGSQSVHPAVPAARPEDAPYLLPGDLHYNQTHSNKHSLTQSNTHSVKQTLTDSHSPAGTHVEILSATDAELDTDAQLEIHSDMHTVTDTHSARTEAESGTHSDTNTAILVQLQQVSAVQAANTERYEGTAVQYLLEAHCHATIHYTFMP